MQKQKNTLQSKKKQFQGSKGQNSEEYVWHTDTVQTILLIASTVTN